MGGEGSQKACLLIVQCDSGHINGNLIACARYRIYDMRAKTLLNTSQFSHITHVLFIVHLPVQATHSSFVGLQGDPWVSCHIDELRPSDPGAIRLEEAQAVPISELFYGGLGRVKPDLERQTSDFAGSVEGMAFEHMRSAEGEDQLMETEEEGERGEEKEGVVEGDMEVIVIEDEEEEETESGSTSRESQEEPMKHDEQQNEDDDVIVMEGPVRRPPSPPSSDVIEMEGPSAAPPDHRQREMDPVSWKDKSFSEMCRQCVRLNGCIQAAASRLQDTDYNKQRAAERVRLLINLIPRKPVFPLGTMYTVVAAWFTKSGGCQTSYPYSLLMIANKPEIATTTGFSVPFSYVMIWYIQCQLACVNIYVQSLILSMGSWCHTSTGCCVRERTSVGTMTGSSMRPWTSIIYKLVALSPMC